MVSKFINTTIDYIKPIDDQIKNSFVRWNLLIKVVLQCYLTM